MGITMKWLDWSIVAALLGLMTYATLATRKHNRGVADFLAAGRCARKYVLGVAEGLSCVGAITIVYWFEMYYRGGFAASWWQLVTLLTQVIVAMSGWIAYRYRQTRALTLAQILEMRYSRRLRIFAGFVIFVSGTLNFGIFPAVAARFFQHFWGLDPHIVSVVGFNVDATYVSIMFVLTALALFFVFAGGQITIMITDFIQGTFANICLAVIAVFLLIKVPWAQVAQALLAHQQANPGQSLVDPFNSLGTRDFNMWFFLIQAAVIFWTYKAWQGTQGYFGAALNAHEARMGGVIGNWRIMNQNMMVLLIPVVAITVLHHPAWSGLAASVQEQLAALPNDTMRDQLRTTITLTRLLPVGLLGAFSAVMMAAFIGTNGTYMHSWGSIFIQDVYMPLRRSKAPLAPAQHFNRLRWAIAGVGFFAFFYSIFFEQNSAIAMYFALTGTIWLGGAGAVIALGLYWSRGTTAGAYTSILTGMVVAIVGFVCQQPYGWKHWFGTEFPLNSQWMMLIAMAASTALYVVVSLLTGKEPFNMDRLLHRGQFAGADATEEARRTGAKKTRRTLAQIIGIDQDFSRLDKILYTFVTSWSFIWSGIFLIGLALHFGGVLTVEHWIRFWHFYVIISVGLGVLTTAWFSIGGCVDLADLLRRLGREERHAKDDGSVVNQHLADE